MGELAHASVPDLKESVGGLRDATVLKALVATWLVDVPHADLEPSRLQLLDVRDVLHEVAGRATDRIAPEVWPDLAAGLGLADAEAAQRQVREIGRRITHLSRLTWQPRRRRARPPAGHPPAGPRARAGRARGRGLPRRGGARPRHRPRPPTRCCCSGPPPRPPSAGWCWRRRRPPGSAREGAALPEPWSREARNLFTRLLAAGPGLLPVWETLDETGALTGCCRSGSGSGCCRTRRWCTASPSTGTWSRPASRRPG